MEDESVAETPVNYVWWYGRLFGKDYSNSHKKMVACFQTKEAYTSHYQTLAFFSVLGVEVTLLRGYKFRQTNFLSSYVKMCADQRKKATNPADKNIHKLMANIIFGKVSVLLLCSTKWNLLKNFRLQFS